MSLILIQVIPQNTVEWTRMAKDLQRRGYADLAHRMAVNAMRTLMSIEEFDATSNLYREWLNNGHTLYPQK
jgi:hypothetical protein